MTVWMFPGQGAQRPGMALGFDAAPRLLRRAGTLLGADLATLCLNDPDPDRRPDLVQPALFVVGVAAATALLRHAPAPTAVIGHSFGEYAALTAVGALEFGTGLRLTALRAAAMLRCPATGTAMAAVLGLDESAVRAVCAEVAEGGGLVEISNINSPAQVVLAGERAALDEATRLCRARGAFRVRPLRVPYAAHTRLMAPAAAELRAALEEAELRPLNAPLYSCITAEATTDPARVKELLVLGMTHTVDFAAAVRAAADGGHRDFAELGPGSPARLLGLVRAVLPQDNPGLRLVSSDAEARTPQPFQAGRVRPGSSSPHPAVAARPSGGEPGHGG
ncbi:[acyl-carrier-protein] S-malonyltransferase [Streptomyces sp. yr375]|uniref:ACP S-malonyltransferase n=1 Tax=Streptomyces sp. yr375 TaxID=1761906 RepID=UPI0008B72B72|nr:ACP S-malonyltransferase [Streptomyces sp. yr375]SER47840.1 [acyl-carrier-protein] S-malonyltransferase [Streptomyces sp. yr375]